MHETLLSPPLIRRVFLEINGAKNQNARSGAETRGEAKRGRRMLGQDFSRGILFRGSRGGGAIYAGSKIVSPPRRKVNKLSIIPVARCP